MKRHTSKKLVTFHNAFKLTGHEQSWPAGDYTIESEQECEGEVPFQRVTVFSTIMVVRPPRGERGKHGKLRFVEIDPEALEIALAADHCQS